MYCIHQKDRERQREGGGGICNSTKCSGISRASLVQHFHFQVHEIWWRSVLVNAWAVAELPLLLSPSLLFLSLSPSPSVSHLGCSQSVSLACVKLNPKTQVPIPTEVQPSRLLSLTPTLGHSLALDWAALVAAQTLEWQNETLWWQLKEEPSAERNGTERSEAKRTQRNWNWERILRIAK